MSNINFKDYLNEQLKDPEFKKEFENETTKLESAIALTKVCLLYTSPSPRD